MKNEGMNDMRKYKVTIESNTYEVEHARLKNMLSIASEGVQHGIYAVFKGKYYELRNDNYNKKDDMKQAIKRYNKKGFIALSNWKW